MLTPDRQDIVSSSQLIVDNPLTHDQEIFKQSLERILREPDIKNIFTAENIKKLSFKEYISLLQLFPGSFLTHVTRQGYRDHANSMWHQAGLGEKHDGFGYILKSSGIKSKMGRYLENTSGENPLISYCNLENVKDRKTALENVRRAFEISGVHSNIYADNSSIHFACDVVMDKMYGCETGNEIFLVLPSLVACTHNQFSGKIDSGNHDEHNDVWIYANPQAGIDLDLCICFIPGDAIVDPETGSKYDKNGVIVTHGISSKEYWEGYFQKNKNFPKCIVYYSSDKTPTQALEEWYRKNKIQKKINSELEENRVSPGFINTSGEKKKYMEEIYNYIDVHYQIDDNFFEEILQSEENDTNFNIEVYFFTDMQKLKYQEYKEKRFFIGVDPLYLEKIKVLGVDDRKKYEQYLEQLFDWQKSSSHLPPPLLI